MGSFRLSDPYSSGTYSLNPDPAKNLNPDPKPVLWIRNYLFRIRIQL